MRLVLSEFALIRLRSRFVLVNAVSVLFVVFPLSLVALIGGFIDSFACLFAQIEVTAIDCSIGISNFSWADELISFE